jgi:hypothetical protein
MNSASGKKDPVYRRCVESKIQKKLYESPFTSYIYGLVSKFPIIQSDLFIGILPGINTHMYGLFRCFLSSFFIYLYFSVYNDVKNLLFVLPQQF